MPNPTNVISPINIHGFGRSGTTLLHNLLGCYRFIQVCGETPGLVFHAHRGGELLLGSHDKEAVGQPHDGRVGGRAVHALFCALLASSKPVWCQKLGGIPNSVVWQELVVDADREYAARPYEFPYAWYWRALRQSFPLSTDLLILRGWRDIVASRVNYSKYDPREMVEGLAVYLNLLAHPASHFDAVFRLEQLVEAPEKIMGRVCDVIGITYDPACLAAMNWYAAGGRNNLAAAREAGFSWRGAYDALGGVFDDEARAVIAPAVERVKVRFGIDLDAGCIGI